MLRNPGDVDLLSVKDVKKNIRYAELPRCKGWRDGVVKDMRAVWIRGVRVIPTWC